MGSPQHMIFDDNKVVAKYKTHGTRQDDLLKSSGKNSGLNSRPHVTVKLLSGTTSALAECTLIQTESPAVRLNRWSWGVIRHKPYDTRLTRHRQFGHAWREGRGASLTTVERSRPVIHWLRPPVTLTLRIWTHTNNLAGDACWRPNPYQQKNITVWVVTDSDHISQLRATLRFWFSVSRSCYICAAEESCWGLVTSSLDVIGIL